MTTPHKVATQKAEELSFIQLFKSINSTFPTGEIVTLARQEEPPDFLVRGIEGDIGMEITKIHKRTAPGHVSLQHQENERKLIARQAQLTCDKRGLSHIHVSLLFYDNPKLGKHNRSLFSEMISDFVSLHVPTAADSACRFHNDFNGDIGLPDCIESVGIGNFPSLTKSFWGVPNAGWVQEDFADELQEVVARKSRRVVAIKSKCKRCWLLVVAENSAASSLFDPSEATREAVYRSDFDRTFYMDFSFGRYFELKTREGRLL